MKHRLEPILLRLDNTDELTQINLKPTAAPKADDPSITADNNVGNRTYSQEFQMQCFMRYQARVMRSDIPSTPQANREKQAAAKNHPYYNVVPHDSESGAVTKITPNITTGSWSGLSSSSQDDDDDYEDGIDMVSFDDKGGFLMVGKTKKKKKGDYLSPLNSFTKGYSHFKHTASTINQESGELPDTMVIGVEGYVQMEGGSTQQSNNEEDIKDGRCKPKKNFWKQLSSNKQKRKEETKSPSPKPSPTTTPTLAARDQNKTAQINYYQPMYNIYQEKPPTPPKPAGLLASLSPRGSGKKLTKPVSPLARHIKSPEEKRRYLAENKTRLSIKPLLQSFDYEDLLGDDLVGQYEASSTSSSTTTKRSQDVELPLRNHLEKTNLSSTRSIILTTGTSIDKSLQNIGSDEIINKNRAKPVDTVAAPGIEPVPKVPTKRNRYNRSSSSAKPLLSSFDDTTDSSLNDDINDDIDPFVDQTSNFKSTVTGGKEDHSSKTIKDGNSTGTRRWTLADQEISIKRELEKNKINQDNNYESANLSGKPLLGALNEGKTYRDCETDSGEGTEKRTSFGNRYSAALDSRINYFETKFLINSP